MANFRYLARQCRAAFDSDRRSCPNCGHGTALTVQRKYLVTTLRRCGRCKLQYRCPTDSPEFAARFYESAYEQGFTTEMPPAEELDKFKSLGFPDQANDYRQYVGLLKHYGAGPRVFELGASWGYGSWVVGQAGFEVTAFEISRSRAEYGHRHLGITYVDEPLDGFVSTAAGTFDVFLAVHVLEHVPSVTQQFAHARALLRPGGLLVAGFPNGGGNYRRRNQSSWRQLWGEVHPQFLDAVFLDAALDDVDRVYLTLPAEVAALPPLEGSRPDVAGDLDRYELVVVARMPQ